MHEYCKYQIEIQNGVDRNGIVSASPLKMKVIRAESVTTLLEIFSDQAGLIGVLRYLHQQGYILLHIHKSNSKKELQEIAADE